MKSLVTILAVAIAVAFTVPAFAGPGSTITNKEDCEKAGKVWDDAGKKCVEKLLRSQTYDSIRASASVGADAELRCLRTV